MRLRSLALLLAFALAPLPSFAARVSVHDNQLFLDGVPQPQLFGAELQYFRLRGGPGRNIPRAEVIALWAKALDRMVEARMNVISFYIPWDFHEYAEGKFDFRGEVDEDGDGNPDYPSRDLFTFFRMIEERGIRRIMVRPGPYINAEWGFLGFGAIPRWFSEKYPDSHMRTPKGRRLRTYDYHSPELHEYTRRWFGTLYREVLRDQIGPGRPVSFLQVDNETNYMWSSIYSGDYSERGLARWREFLRTKFGGEISALNAAFNSKYSSWEQIDAPREARQNVGVDRAWYEFQDEGLHIYLKRIRAYWEELGVHEPDVLFTLAESYNAPDNGMLPNYRYRNDPGGTGMMTVNLYPKTYDPASHPLMNQPFKADHDVKSGDAASDYYLGSREEWVMGPEIQGGWWRETNVSKESRQQTYLTTIGHGLKALFVYYFTDGENWEPLWVREQARPYYDELRRTEAFRHYEPGALPWEFWGQLQEIVDEKVLAALPVYASFQLTPEHLEELFFDAPLDRHANARDHYEELKELATKVIDPYKDFLGRAVAVEDRVCLLRDTLQHLPSPHPDLNSILMNGEWSAGLLGWLMHTGANPRVLHWGLNPSSALNDCDLLVWQDNGVTDPALAAALRARIEAGATVVSTLESSLAKGLGFRAQARYLPAGLEARLSYAGRSFSSDPNLNFAYELNDEDCKPLVGNDRGDTVGYECRRGRGHFVQLGALPYKDYGANEYYTIADAPARLSLARHFLELAGVSPRLGLPEDNGRTVAFARTTGGERLWITTKTGEEGGAEFALRVRGLKPTSLYRVQNLLSGEAQHLTGAALAREGFPAKLASYGSTVYFVEPAGAIPGEG